MNEIKEIMNGNIKIFNMRIEGETIGFDTPYNSNWNFMARDFEQIIDTLQQENTRLKEKIEKAIEKIKNIDKYEERLNDDTRVYMIQDVDVDEIERILREN